MSRPAKPQSDAEFVAHRIQYYFKPTAEDHVLWLKVNKAMKRNGLPTLAALVGMLLSRELDRLGITDETVLDEPKAPTKGSAKRTKRA